MQVSNRLTPFFENLNFERDDNTMVINFGPQHPSAHGQMRLILEMKGEEIVKAHPDVGYLHRGIEKMAENMIYNEFLPTTDRMDYIAATANNYAFAVAVERLLGIEDKVPRRAKVIRTMLLELNRIISHLFWLGTHAMDVGALSVMMYTFREREYAMDLMEDYCGARLTHSAVRIGGVPLDLPKDFITKMQSYLDTLVEQIGMYESLLSENRVWRMRLEDIGIVDAAMAKTWASSGPLLRGAGVKYDIRKEEPYELYSELEFDVPVSEDVHDSYARYLLHLREMKESVKIIKQLMVMYPSTESQLMARVPEYISAPKEDIMTQNYSLMQHFVLVTQGMRPPIGEVYVPTESPKGELGFYINSQGGPYPHRLKARAPSFWHTSILQELLVGLQLADIVTVIGNLNVVFGEIDR